MSHELSFCFFSSRRRHTISTRDWSSDVCSSDLWLGRHGVWLEDLYVTPRLRGAGLGRALLAELARICVRQGYGRLDWWVLDWNSAARGFYESLGAVAMEDWTVHRLTGPALRALADSATGPAS